MSVARISTHKNAVVKGILFRNPLSNGVHRVPLDSEPLDRVRAKDSLRRLLDLFGAGRLFRMPVAIIRRCDLHVQPDHVILAGDDHD